MYIMGKGVWGGICYIEGVWGVEVMVVVGDDGLIGSISISPRKMCFTFMFIGHDVVYITLEIPPKRHRLPVFDSHSL